MDRSRFKTTRTIANLRAGRNDWYRIKAQAGAPTQVMVYDEIGWWGVTAQDFIDDLKDIQGPIDLHLNSPGGEVFDGIAIHAFLAARGNVTTYVDALAASIASVIAMAGTEIVMGRNASMMIHDGFGMCIGNAADMREQAELLDRVSDNIASIYADRTGKPVADWRAAMLAETWYIGQEAVDAGLADRLVPQAAPAGTGQTVVPGAGGGNWDEDLQQMAATFDLSVFRRVPQALRNQMSEAPETAVPEPEAVPPPTPEAPPTEAPAETDRGFVVPGPEADVESERGPDVRTVEIEWSGEGSGDALLAWLRTNLRIRGSANQVADPDDGSDSQRILGLESMPLLNKAIPVHHTATEDTAWDGPAAVAAMPAEYADLHYCHAWQSADADESSHTPGDDDEDDKKSAFKFPHHEKKGGPANLAACRNGKARLSGADIPDADRAGVEAHLQAHLDDAEKGDDETKNHTHDNPGDAWTWDPKQFIQAVEGAH